MAGVRDVDAGREHVAEVQTAGVEHGLQPGEALPGLPFDVALGVTVGAAAREAGEVEPIADGDRLRQR